MNEPNDLQQSTLRETCVLVDYHGGFAAWQKRDAGASRAYSKSATNSEQSYTNYKNIFVGCDAVLSSIKQVINEARAFHYSITLPAPKAWGTAAFISNALVPTYRQTMTQFEIKLDSLKQHLRNEWDSMQQAAKTNLGKAYNPADYGDLEGILAKCYISVDFRPVPSGKDLSNHPTLAFIKDAVEEETGKAYDSAITEMWGRLIESVKAARENLMKLDTGVSSRFRTEWLSNMREMLPILKGLNITQDQKFDAFADEASQLLCYDEKTLKQSMSKREELAEKADKLFKKLAALSPQAVTK